jgi:hypothetical protein
MLDDGCLSEGCSLTPVQKAIDAQKQKKHEEEAARRKCAKGNRAYCSGDPKEIALFTITSLTGVTALETFLLGGGLAAGADALMLQAGSACLQSAVCRAIFGLAGGAGSTSISAHELYYSQRGISASTKAGISLDDFSQEIAQGWNGDPLRVLKIGNQLVSLDNRRLAVAKMLDIKVPVTISEGYTTSDLVTQFHRDGIFSQIAIRGTGMFIDMLGRIGGP